MLLPIPNFYEVQVLLVGEVQVLLAGEVQVLLAGEVQVLLAGGVEEAGRFQCTRWAELSPHRLEEKENRSSIHRDSRSQSRTPLAQPLTMVRSPHRKVGD